MWAVCLAIQNNSAIFAIVTKYDITMMKNETKTLRGLVATLMLVLGMNATTAQEHYRHVITPEYSFGAHFNADTNHPTFTGSLRLSAQLGNIDDLFNVNLGLGYRGFWDRRPPVKFLRHESVSDWLFYSRDDGHTKSVRPMGGQLVVPAEVMLNMFRLSDGDVSIFLGCGVEYGLRIYQSHRYGDYYGDHVMTANSLCYYPMAGVHFDTDDCIISLSLYWRHYVKRPLNGEAIDIDKFTAKDFFGLQVGLVL